MQKLKMESVDRTLKNIEGIGALFPHVITEIMGDDGKLKKGINFELLKQELATDIVDGEECYEFRWVGKKASILEGNTPIRKTLRPVIEESRDWETTGNLYLEGDNLDVLKLLQESYLNSIKLIYIDPPYNTGKDSFVYPDNYIMDNKVYEEEINYRNEEGYIHFKLNNSTNPRFHSDWCSMLFPRLKLARNLMTEDGMIFISINDHEVDNLKKLSNEVFGENNFIAQLVWLNKEGGGSSDSKTFRIKHEYILCYAKNIERIEIEGVPIHNHVRYTMADETIETRGPYYLQKLGMGSIQYSKRLDYPIEAPDGTLITPADNNSGKKACWRWSQEKYAWGMKNGFIVIKKDNRDIWTVYTKQYLKCDNDGNLIERMQRPFGVIDSFSSTQASKFLDRIQLGRFFDYSKPTELIQYLISLCGDPAAIVLDFFSGSATTAHAVMKLNAEDDGNRKFIMVQLPEPTDEKGEAYQAGYKTICDIGKERIRRSGDKVKEEVETEVKIKVKSNDNDNDIEELNDVDIGFRVFKLDSTNMKDVYYAAHEYNQQMLQELELNIKEDRTDLDLLFGVLLELGLPLSLKHTVEDIEGVRVHTANQGSLIACLEERISEQVVREIAKHQPERAVFRDSSFENISDKLNVQELFRLLAPQTRVIVI